MTRCCTHACNQGRDCPHRLWSRFDARAEAKPDAAPYLRIVALMFTAAALMVVGVAS